MPTITFYKSKRLDPENIYNGSAVYTPPTAPADYARSDHDHDGIYSPVGHDHLGEYLSADAKLGALDDVDNTVLTPGPDDTIVYNNTTNKFELKRFRLTNLIDVSGTPADGQILQYSQQSGYFEIVNLPPASVGNLNDVGDVSISSPETWHYLKWNGTAWVNSSLGSHQHNLSDIADLSLNSPTEGEVITYDATNSILRNQTLTEAGISPAGHSHSLVNLSDVTYPAGQTTGNALVYNGSGWIAGAYAFSDLSNKPTTLSGYGITDASPAKPPIISKTSNFTLSASDNGKVIICPTGVTQITCPASLGEGFNVQILQYQTNTISIIAGSGATRYSKDGNYKMSNQYGGVSILYTSSSAFVLVGDLSA